MYGAVLRCAGWLESNSSRVIPRQQRHLRFLSWTLSIPISRYATRISLGHQRRLGCRLYTHQAEPAVELGGSQQSQILTHPQAYLRTKSHRQTPLHTCSVVSPVSTVPFVDAAIRTAPPHNPTAAHFLYRDCLSVNKRRNIFASTSVVESKSLSFLNSFSHQKRLFSSTTMVAAKLDGNAIAKSIREKLCAEVTEKQKLNPRFKPCLKIIQGMTKLLVILYLFNADSIVSQWVIVQTPVRHNPAPPS